MKEPFQFKEFAVQQDKTAMKIGTDAVLLGAWCNLDNFPDTILDVGSGTGIIALMMAQRCDAPTIDAVETDENAYEQSVDNFEKSDWGDRLYCYHATFNDFVDEISEEEETYDFIVSNPPYYQDDFETDNVARNKARFTSSLSFDELLSGVSKILAENGTFAVIIPKKEEAHFIALAASNKLFLNRICDVQGNKTAAIKRCLMEFSFHKTTVTKEHLMIETARHKYTEAYIDLTKDFYLKM